MENSTLAQVFSEFSNTSFSSLDKLLIKQASYFCFLLLKESTIYLKQGWIDEALYSSFLGTEISQLR